MDECSSIKIKRLIEQFQRFCFQTDPTVDLG